MNSQSGLLALECLNCALNQIISVSQMCDLPRDRSMALMQRAIDSLSEKGVERNNCVIIEEFYRMATTEVGVENPYAEIKAHFNRGIMRLWPQVRQRIAESDDPLRAAIRAAIAGNLIDLAALGLDVSMDAAMEKLEQVDETGLAIDHVDALKAQLEKAKTLLVLGDNCGEIALDRLLIETIQTLYPQLHIQFGVRGKATVNDVTREDAAMVGMDEVAEVIDNGDSLLTTALWRTSPEFNRNFYGADVVICKGMGNYEGLYDCDRENIWFMLIAKCDVLSRMTGTKKGSIICLEKGREPCKQVKWPDAEQSHG